MTSLRKKVEMYERFLHQLNMYSAITMDGEKVGKLIENACGWSYAHRQGNGELSDREQNTLINRRFERLCDV